MLSANQIRKNLEDIRYYYGRRDMFDKAFDSVGKSGILQIVNMYNQAICNASPKLYEIYVALYVKCCTYEFAAEELGFSVSYVYKTNRKLVTFFFNEFNKEAA